MKEFNFFRKLPRTKRVLSYFVNPESIVLVGLGCLALYSPVLGFLSFDILDRVILLAIVMMLGVDFSQPQTNVIQLEDLNKAKETSLTFGRSTLYGDMYSHFVDRLFNALTKHVWLKAVLPLIFLSGPLFLLVLAIPFLLACLFLLILISPILMAYEVQDSEMKQVVLILSLVVGLASLVTLGFLGKKLPRRFRQFLRPREVIEASKPPFKKWLKDHNLMVECQIVGRNKEGVVMVTLGFNRQPPIGDSKFRLNLRWDHGQNEQPIPQLISPGEPCEIQLPYATYFEGQLPPEHRVELEVYVQLMEQEHGPASFVIEANQLVRSSKQVVMSVNGQPLSSNPLAPKLGAIGLVLATLLMVSTLSTMRAEHREFQELTGLVHSAASANPTPQLNEKIVHARGLLQSREALSDPMFLKPGPWLGLERRVFVRVKGKGSSSSGGHWVRSDGAKIKGSVPNKKFYVPVSTFGSYSGNEVVKRIFTYKLTVEREHLINPHDEILSGNIIRRKASRKGQPLQPGDEKISFTVIEPGKVSVIAKQLNQKHLGPFQLGENESEFLIWRNYHSKVEMLEKEYKSSGAIMKLLGCMLWLTLGFYGLFPVLRKRFSQNPLILHLGSYKNFSGSLILAGGVFWLLATCMELLFNFNLATVIWTGITGGAYFFWHRHHQALVTKIHTSDHSVLRDKAS